MSAKPRPVPAVLRPGSEGWEFWRFNTKGEPVREPEQNASRAGHFTVAAPTRTFLALPLWISPAGDPSELVGLEFAARHLSRRGHQIAAIEIERDADRALVLGVLASDDTVLEALHRRAAAYEAPARLLDTGDADLALWKEDGEVCYACYRKGKNVYFSPTGESRLTPDAASIVARAALRLHAEEVLLHLPQSAVLFGTFDTGEKEALESAMGITVDFQPALPPPKLPELAADLAPPAAVSRREKKQQIKKIALIAAVAAAIYLLVAAIAGWFYVAGAFRLAKLKAEADALRGPATEARAASERWKAIRPAVDPSLFALDVFAAVAKEIPADNVRFTQFTYGGGVVLVAGEAADVSQTYELIERLKKSPQLAEFDWTARPPEIAAKSTIRFQIEGRMPDAATDTN